MDRRVAIVIVVIVVIVVALAIWFGPMGYHLPGGGAPSTTGGPTY